MLEQIKDPILTYEDSWFCHLPVLEQADLILILPQEHGESQEAIVYRLLSLLPGKLLTVFSTHPVMLQMLEGHDLLNIIDMSVENLKVSHIMEDDLIRNARRINLRYAHIYANVEETEKNAITEWEKLDAFTRYSNISSADYHEIRLQMLTQIGVLPDGIGLDTEQKEYLSELEHMRWCRYHWLNNWRFGIPENGKAKDNKNRIHIDLIPYEKLSETEKEKDRDTIDVLLGL